VAFPSSTVPRRAVLRLAPVVRRALVVPVAAAQVVLAAWAAMNPRLVFSLLLLGITGAVAMVLPVPVLLAVAPSTFGYWRVGPAALDMSVADAMVVIGTLAALPYVPWRNRALRLMLVALAFYTAVMAVSVVASPSTAAAFEVAHRAVMVAGSLFIGAALATLGRARAALRVFLAACVVVALAAIAVGVSSGLEPAYPFGMHKNAVGALLASGLLVLVATRSTLGLGGMLTIGGGVTILAGLLASQSRGAALGLAAASAVYLFRHGGQRWVRFAPVILVVSLAMLAFAILSFNAEQSSVQGTSAAQHSSYTTRISTYSYAIEHVWKPHVLFGSGPRWFMLPGAGAGVPHNLVIQELSETGIVGLGGLTLLLGVMLARLWRMRTPLGDAGFLVLSERILDSMLGILWVAGTGTLPFLVVGLAVGDDELRRRRTEEQAELVAA